MKTEKLQPTDPVAFLYTLEYGKTVVDKKVSIDQLNYPFGVCGADYQAKNEDGVSYVRQTFLYTHPKEWQDLTYEEIVDEYFRFEVTEGGFNRFECVVRAIEAKLRSKNI